MPIIRMPNGDQVNFPDTMKKEEIKSFILSKFPGSDMPENQGLKRYNPNLSDEEISTIKKTGDDYSKQKEDFYSKSGLQRAILNDVQNPGEMVKNVPDAFIPAIETGLQGATMGGYGALNRALGGNYQERRDNAQQLADDAGMGGWYSGAKIGTELATGISSPIMKVLLPLSKGATATSTVAKNVGLGGLQGALSNYGEGGDVATGAGMGGIIGGIIPGVPALARALKGTSGISKSSQGNLLNIASDNKATETVRRGMRVDDKLANVQAEKAEQLLEESGSRIKEALGIGDKNSTVSKLAQTAQKRYADFMDTYGLKTIGTKNIKNSQFDRIIKENPIISDIEEQIIKRDPNFSNTTPKNSVKWMQEVRSNLNSKLINMSDDSVDKKYYQKAADAIESLIDDNFKDYSQLQKLWNDKKIAEELLEAVKVRIGKSNENSNIAKTLLKNNTKEGIQRVFGEKEGQKIIEALRKERGITENLTKISKESKKDFLGGLDTSLIGGFAAGTFLNPASLLGASSVVGGKLLGRALSRKGARDIIAGTANKKYTEFGNMLRSSLIQQINN